MGFPMGSSPCWASRWDDERWMSRAMCASVVRQKKRHNNNNNNNNDNNNNNTNDNNNDNM